MAGKPVLDMMIGLRRPADLTEFPTVVLSALGYVPRVFSAASGGRNAMPPDRLMFSKYAPPGVNLHLFVFGDASWRRCTNIRDNLRTRPDVAAFIKKSSKGLRENIKLITRVIRWQRCRSWTR